MLGILTEEKNDSNMLDGVIQMLLNMRKEAKANKDFALSDKIRDDLSALGLKIKDSREGTTWSK